MVQRQGMRYNARLGRFRPVNRKRSMIAKRSARKRKGKRQTMATKMKRRRSIMKMIRSGRTKFGRKVRRPAHHMHRHH
jgi:hypothetical protein